ncbi:interferon alpha-inducible protein 27, mitochondrial [Callorhinchus milii]|uniref:Interferon alpha-inducible protein 27-like protein 1 n=1 Tax=Callorhinchus milii TaxID=7868 RepID=V9LI28_CALMI|nr:interferon alpha-inducible protein 27, mitochondrial [Callorhinchus milii]|eukprot:gi/632976116/ref/XP_007904616.1/ PREDICTED: interferon alpha-inducible protein 27-like protein 1 [Callorhinchus milii]
MRCLVMLTVVLCSFCTVEAISRSKALLMSVGAGGAIVGARSCITALGFTSSGIKSGSWASTLMSTVTYLNGGRIPPGSFVTTLESIGTSGFSIETKIILGFIGGILAIFITNKLNIF